MSKTKIVVLGAIVGLFTVPVIGQTPYSGTLMLPAQPSLTIEAERFDNGSDGVAYHDTTKGNSGGQFRTTTDVDIEATTDTGSGYDVGWIDAGEWLGYTITVPVAATYAVEVRVAAAGQGGTFHLEVAGKNLTGVVTIPDTGGWQAWQTVHATAALNAGSQQVRLVFDTAGAVVGNVNWLRFTVLPPSQVSAAPTPVPTPTPTPTPTPLPIPIPTGAQTFTVPAGGDLQAAINKAQLGDMILLASGATFTGNFILPVKSGNSYLTISSAAVPDGRASATPTVWLQGKSGGPTVATVGGAHHYRLVGIGLKASGFGDVIELGSGDCTVQNTLASVPHDLDLDRVVIIGDPTAGQKRGIALNSASTTIENSYIAGIRVQGQDSQAISGWNGPGPFTIVNNYLEAASENIMFGGADPCIQNLVPSDITIRHNYLFKPLAWKAQPGWNVKNLFELKNAQRVIVDGNILENNWADAQSGYAIALTVRNQDHTAPWSAVQHVQFTNNIVRHAGGGVNILGTDNNATSQVSNDFLIRNNLFEDITGATWGGQGRWIIINGGYNITFDHNTVFQDGWTSLYSDTTPTQQFTFTNNIIPDYSWAVLGTAAGVGNPTIAAQFPGSTFAKGIFAGSNPALYPVNNYYPASYSAVGFVNQSGGNYRLAVGSAYKSAATDGKDVGADIDAINAATGAKY